MIEATEEVFNGFNAAKKLYRKTDPSSSKSA
jgi:hypothetical protein